MKNLDLNVYGVMEMDVSEERYTNGGFGPISWFVAGLLAGAFLDRDFASDFQEGFDIGYQMIQ